MFLVDMFFQSDKFLHPEELSTSIGYYNRMHRDYIEVDSEAFNVRRMLFVSDIPGKYIGTGDKVDLQT